MLGHLELKTAAAEEPVTLAEQKDHLKIETGVLADDDMITGHLKAARLKVESITWRQMITATWYWKLPGFPGTPLLVPLPPLQSLGITYKDSNGDIQTLADTVYGVSNFYAAGAAQETAGNGRIYLKYGQTWPSTYAEEDAVTIEFIAGYGAAANVPEGIKSAIKLIAANAYENREPVNIGNITSEIPMSVPYLLADFSARRF